jgi:hypothetical protein
MGPLRRGLILALLPGPALADVCASVRPNWIPGTPSTALTEAIALFGTVPSLGLILLTALALRFRSQWGGLTVVVLWAGWTSLVALTGDAMMAQARLEGCVGSPVLFLSGVAAICAGTVLYTLPKSTRL